MHGNTPSLVAGDAEVAVPPGCLLEFAPLTTLSVSRADFHLDKHSMNPHADREPVPDAGPATDQVSLLRGARRPVQVPARVEGGPAGGRHPAEAADRLVDEPLADQNGEAYVRAISHAAEIAGR